MKEIFKVKFVIDPDRRAEVFIEADSLEDAVDHADIFYPTWDEIRILPPEEARLH